MKFTEEGQLKGSCGPEVSNLFRLGTAIGPRGSCSNFQQSLGNSDKKTG